MNEEQVGRAIESLELALERDDPAFVRRFQNLRRAEIVTAISVFVLLAAGAVLLTVGLALPSLPAWAAGLLALVGSVLVDEHHKRVLRRSL